MKRMFSMVLIFFVCLSTQAQQRSQAIDLLEYDLAALKVKKQDAQDHIDNMLYFTAGGFLSIFCARLFLPSYNLDTLGLEHPLASTGGMTLDFIGVALILFPWRNVIRKFKIKRYITKVKKQIAVLKKAETYL